MVLAGLVVLLKLVSTVSTGLLPAAWRTVDAPYAVRLDVADDAAQLGALVLVSLALHVAGRAPGQRASWVAALLMAGALGALCVAPRLPLAWLVAVLAVAEGALLVLQQRAVVAALSAGSGLARPRLLGTVAAQLLLLVALVVPAPRALLAAFAVATAVGCGALAARVHTSGAQVDEAATEALPTVSWAAGLVFLAVATVGLNGEQILDAQLKLSLKSAAALGRVAPLALHHALTLGARVAAYASSASRLSAMEPLALLALWTGAQAVRLFFLHGIGAEALPLPVVGMLIGTCVPVWVWVCVWVCWCTRNRSLALDKYSGSMGEIALEAVLLQWLAGVAPAAGVAGAVLVAWMQPLETLSGANAKLMARSASLGSWPVVAALSCFPLVAARWLLPLALRRLGRSAEKR